MLNPNHIFRGRSCSVNLAESGRKLFHPLHMSTYPIGMRQYGLEGNCSTIFESSLRQSFSFSTKTPICEFQNYLSGKTIRHYYSGKENLGMKTKHKFQLKLQKQAKKHCRLPTKRERSKDRFRSFQSPVTHACRECLW